MSDIISQLKVLKLHGMADCYTELKSQGASGATASLASSEWLLRQLLEAESNDRGIRSIRYQINAAKFPIHRNLQGFDFSQSKVDEQLIGRLATMEFTDAAQNLVLVGGTGTGKTHLATALGVSGIQYHGKRIRFYSTVDLVNTLEQEKAAGKQGRLAISLMQMDLVILDELGYLPFSQAGGALLFHLLSKLYERTSVIITTNLTFAEWGSHTCVALLNAGHDVAIVDNLSNSRVEVIERIKLISKRVPAFFNVDVRDRVAVDAVFDSFHPEAVIHFAGLKAVGESLQYPLRYYEWNVSGSVVLFQVMVKKNVKRLVFSSSANVYGDAIEVPIRENTRIDPTNPYGQSKAMIEHILADLVAADTEWRVARLRYFNPMGAHESGLIGEDPNGVPSNLPPYIAQVAVGKLDELQIFGGDYSTPDGTGVRDYIHVMDLALGHLAALDYLASERGLLTVNLGTGRGYSVLELVNAFENACGKPVPYRIVERRSGDVAKSFADPSEAARWLGWQARFGLDDMCRDAWRWQSMNPQGYGTKP